MRSIVLSSIVLGSWGLAAGCGGPEGLAVDAAIAGDAGSATDAPARADAAPSEDAATCGTLGGTETHAQSCATSTGGFAMQVAIVLTDPAAPRVIVSGNGLPRARTTSCDVVDHVTVRVPAGVLADFDVAALPVEGVGRGGALEGPASALATSVCASDADRFGAATLLLDGRTVGGTFETTCGGGLAGSFPPPIVVTCHRAFPPSTATTSAQDPAVGGGATVQTTVLSSEALGVTSIESSVDLLVAGGATRSSEGWSLAYLSPISRPDFAAAYVYDFALHAAEGAIGDLCIAPSQGGPPVASTPLIFRVRGMTSTGPFSTEIYAEGCYHAVQ